eukprot:2461225-Rhodomonas_salina.1
MRARAFLVQSVRGSRRCAFDFALLVSDTRSISWRGQGEHRYLPMRCGTEIASSTVRFAVLRWCMLLSAAM